LAQESESEHANPTHGLHALNEAMVRLAMLVALVLSALCVAPCTARLHQNDAASVDSETVFPSAPVLEKHLRLCNGFAAKEPVVVRGASFNMITKDPIGYKKCADLTLPLVDGEELMFMAGDKQVGAFTVSGLPRSTASLLLVVYRRSKGSSAAFDSHVYSSSNLAQIAVIDAYNGAASDALEIYGTDGKTEPLRFGSIAYANPGEYNVRLTGADTEDQPTRIERLLTVLGGPPGRSASVTIGAGTRYVAMRVGAGGSEEFPEELVLLGRAAAAPVGALLLLALPRFLQGL